MTDSTDLSISTSVPSVQTAPAVPLSPWWTNAKLLVQLVLNLPVRFKYTEATPLPQGGVQLFPEGDYLLREYRLYDGKVRCEACGHDYQAQHIGFLEELNTKQGVVMGLDCLEKYYGVSRSQIDGRKNAVANTWRDLNRRLGMEAVSIEIHLRRIATLISRFIPDSHKLVRELSLLIHKETLELEELKRIEELFDLAGVYREFQLNCEQLLHRIEALEHHPRWGVGGNKAVREDCKALRTLCNRGELRSDTVLRWTRHLRKVARWSRKGTALVSPENQADATSYRQALVAALKVAVNSGEYGTAGWRGTIQWDDQLDFRQGKRHQTFAVEEKALTRQKMHFRDVRKWREQGHQVLIEESDQIYHDSYGAKVKHERDEDGDWVPKIVDAIPVTYKIVGVALLEPFFGAYPLWVRYKNRSVLECFTYPEE